MAVIKEFEHLRIPFLDIKLATKNFTTLIGVGGYGSVYRGELLLTGKLTSVAVKRLTNINLSGQGLKEFLTEIHLLSRYKHPNLVTLLGFCEETDEKILIYNYAERGSFNNYLNPAEITCPLTWKQRINICIDAASGLDHLHNHIATNHRIIHRDIKSANLLLDLNWNCMIADFGLSKIGRANENETYLITNAGGTHGYCDPVYIDTGILTKKSDVYSFGVVLFEALCGRLCFKNVIGEHRHLVPLARRCYQEGKLNSIMDLDLKNSESMKEFSEIAYRCLHDDPKERPSMDWVLRKLEKTLELLESEEACEAQKLEEALGLQIFVKSMQVQEFVEALVSQELEEALEWEVLVETMKFHKLGEILELQNYALIKALHMMTNTLPTCATREEVYAHLSTGVLVDDGKVWFSIDENGKNQEMVSAMKFLHLEPNKCEAISLPESRFPVVANILNATNANIQLKIRTQFLSSDVTYAVYLLCKHRDSVQYPVIISVKYKLNNHRQSYFSFPGASKDGWSMMELCHTNCLKRDVELEVFLEEFYVDISEDGDQVIVEGILFLPIQKFEDEKVKTQEKENLPTSEIDWENRLPVDYKQFIYYRGKKMGKKAQNCVITESKEEAYSILTKGVSIMLDDGVSAWFWITKSNQKKCFMLPANSIIVSKHHGTYVRNPHEYRFKYTLHVKCSNRLFMSFKIRNPLLSFKTAYGCYLVYQMSEPLRIPLEVSGGETNLQSGYRWYDQKKLVYLSTPQIPVIGSEDLEQISHSTMNKTEMIGYPRERTDGWWEVRLGEFITHDDVFKKSQRRICMCIPSFPDEEATTEPNDETRSTIASLFPGYKPEISFGMSWPRSQRTYTNFSLSFRVQGIEFRPL